MQLIDASRLRLWIDDGSELAVLDAREEGEFGSGHLFWAVPCPLSQAELRIPALVPRLGTRIVVTDAGEPPLATRLAALLEALGASDVHVLAGGTPAWAAAGHALFTGVNVPSKAFGEWVEHRYGTESIDAIELMAWQGEGRDVAVFDSRPLHEFRRMSIPGAVNVPGGELAYRIRDLVPSAATTIVVNCAGRTRSIMGAESLRRAGIPNRVVALRNGTMGWQLAGLELVHERTERFRPGVPDHVADALAQATGFAERSGVRTIGPLDLARFEQDAERTLYVLDVRDPVEFAEVRRSGSRNAPGGQLIQATDHWIAVRGARIAVVDDDGVRARMAAAWLRQMGHRDVFVVHDALAGAVRPPPASPTMTGVGPEAIKGALVVDLARSIDFRAGHIPGAVWGIRARLDRLSDWLRGAGRVVVTSPDGVLAGMAVEEVRGLTDAPVDNLAGGTSAWVAAGGELIADRNDPPDAACVDCYLRPYDRNSGVDAAMRAYLTWEVELMRDLERDGSVAFGV